MFGTLLFIVIIIVIIIVIRYLMRQEPRIPEMEEVARKIMTHTSITPPSFVIRHTKGKTRTKIDSTPAVMHLRTHKSTKGAPYDHQTLMYALIYQLSILISPDTHTSSFYRTLDRLSLSAKQLGIYDPWATRDAMYPM